jgi:hypothetical protein
MGFYQLMLGYFFLYRQSSLYCLGIDHLRDPCQPADFLDVPVDFLFPDFGQVILVLFQDRFQFWSDGNDDFLF